MILHVDTGDSYRGGQRQLMQLADRLKQAGIEQALAVPPSNPLLNRLDGIYKIRLWDNNLMRRLFPGRLIDYIQNNPVKIIHTHDSEAHSIGIMLKKAFPRLKLIVSRRVVFPPSIGVSAFFKYRRHVDKYIAVSFAAANVLVAHGIDDDKITVIHSAIDIDAIQDLEADDTALRPILGKFPRLIASAGALTAEKDFPTAINAVASLHGKFPDVALIILGEGPERPALESLIENQNIKNVFLFGHHEPMSPILKNCQAFMLTSTSEGLNNSVIEATACGLPAVVSNVGGLPEIVEHGVNGCLCAPGDTAAFASALELLLTDKKYYDMLSMSAGYMARRFDITELCKKTVDVYNSVLVSNKNRV